MEQVRLVEIFPPHTRRHAPRVLAVVAVTLGLLVTAAVPLAQADDLKHRHKTVRKHIKSAQVDVDESSHALTRAMSRLKASRARLHSAQSRLRATRAQLRQAQVRDRQMQAALVRAQAALVKARADLAQGRIDVLNQRDDIGRMAADSLAYGDPSLMRLSLLDSSMTTQDITNQFAVADSVHNRESNALSLLEQTRDRLVVQAANVETAKARVAAQKQATHANVLRKQALTRQASAAEVQVLHLVRRHKQLAVSARIARKHDLRKLKNLEAEEASIVRAIKKRAAQQHGGFSGDTGGFLYRPVPGWVTSPYGWRRHPIYGYWGLHDGTDFHAPCGTPERAGGAGKVVDEYYSSVWGNRLILDLGQVNGKNMTLIYNHISDYRVHEGARVDRGEVLAYAGTTGWSTGCHLHFTVMLDGNTVDPMKYM